MTALDSTLSAECLHMCRLSIRAILTFSVYCMCGGMCRTYGDKCVQCGLCGQSVVNMHGFKLGSMPPID